MNKLMWNEIRKTMQIRTTYIYAAIVILISLFFAWYCVSTSGTDVVNEDGSTTIVKGVSAISLQKQTESTMSGEVTQEKLENALRTVQEHYNETKDTFIYDDDFLRSQRIWSLISGLIYTYPQYNKDSYTNISQIPEEMASDYYKIRNKKIDKMINGLYSETSQLQKAEKMSADVKTPFSYYAGYDYWNTVFEYYGILIMAILIVASFFIAPIFAENYSNGADAIFRTTKYGRKALGVCRVVVAEIYALFLFVVSSILFLGITAFYFGTEGLQSSIQMMTTYSIADLTYGQALLYMIIGGSVSILGTVSMIVFFSAKMKTSISAMIISIALIISWKALSMFFTVGSTISFILSTLPMSGSEMIYFLNSFNIFKVLNINIWEPYWSIISGVLISIIFFFITVNEYARKKY